MELANKRDESPLPAMPVRRWPHFGLSLQSTYFVCFRTIWLSDAANFVDRCRQFGGIVKVFWNMPEGRPLRIRGSPLSKLR